jgi:hypothetical protein
MERESKILSEIKCIKCEYTSFDTTEFVYLLREHEDHKRYDRICVECQDCTCIGGSTENYDHLIGETDIVCDYCMPCTLKMEETSEILDEIECFICNFVSFETSEFVYILREDEDLKRTSHRVCIDCQKCTCIGGSTEEYDNLKGDTEIVCNFCLPSDNCVDRYDGYF